MERVQAKIDTGAFRSALHYVKVRTRTVDGNKQLVVTFGMARKRVTMVFKRFQRVSVKSSNGETSRRWLITTVSLNGSAVRTEFTLFDRSGMRHQVLLGRKLLRGGRGVEERVRVNSHAGQATTYFRYSCAQNMSNRTSR